MESLQKHLSEILECDILFIDYVTKGQLGDIYKVKSSDRTYILKTSKPSAQLHTEASMLKDINKYDIAVPTVYDVSDSHLLTVLFLSCSNN